MRVMGIAYIVAIIVWGTGWAVSAAVQRQEMIKDVPQGATIEYLIQGRVVQSMSLRPGRYRITVEELK